MILLVVISTQPFFLQHKCKRSCLLPAAQMQAIVYMFAERFVELLYIPASLCTRCSMFLKLCVPELYILYVLRS